MMKQSMQVRMSQHLALTPQLQQSIRLLQLSTLELQQEIQSMLEQNPLLDVEEDALGLPEPLAERTSNIERAAERETEQASATDEASHTDTATGLDQTEFGGTEREDWENGTEADDFDGIGETPLIASNSSSSGAGDNDDFSPQERDASEPSLQAHLRQQLLGLHLSEADCMAVQMLIDSLDDDGYLLDSLQDIAEQLMSGVDAAMRQSLLEHLQFGLKWLQQMEPLGVGAANLVECLVLQLRAQPRSEVQAIAIIICTHHLELLARRDMKKLMAATGAEQTLIQQAQSLIQTLEPKPGRPFAKTNHNIIVPDVIVQRSGRGWRAVLNPEVMPKLCVNQLYAKAIGQGRGQSSPALSGQLQEARWFIKNIQQRFDTIARVSQAIVERQKNFFTHGAIAMKPLVLREIADELGLHESTISRVTTAKYMATLFGTFELKYFFGSSLSTETGGNASSTAVRVLIKQLIEAEDETQPLSDSALSTLLQEQGIQVARRTVAKYREALQIAPVNLRRRM
jgi:RNA polymerase sigma-54 factor